MLLAGSDLPAQRNNCNPTGTGRSGGNVPYDGRFIMTRISYFDYAYNDSWCFDWPAMERNFVLILREITQMHPRMDASQLFSFDNPELFKYPMVYLTEPGFWTPTPSELKGMRDYMLKGGFVFFDDFWDRSRYPEWNNFEAQFRRAFPDVIFFRLDNTEPIFDSFYKISNLAVPYPPNYIDVTAEFYGVYEDNDPGKHMMAIVSYNSDLGDYMEWSGTGRSPINVSNDAFKFAVNFVVYAMTR